MEPIITIYPDKEIKLSFFNGDFIIFETETKIPFEHGIYVLDADNAVGKSSLLSILSLINSPQISEATITISYRGEKDIDYSYLYSQAGLATQLEIRKNKMVIITQEPYMLPLSIADNLSILGLEEAEQKAIFARLSEVWSNLTPERKICSLSGGQVQRIFIEMMFSRIKDEDRVIFIDEPFNNLSDANTAILLNKIRKYARKHLVLLVDHSIPLKSYNADTVDKLYRVKVTTNEPKTMSIELKLINGDKIDGFIDSYITERKR